MLARFRPIWIQRGLYPNIPSGQHMHGVTYRRSWLGGHQRIFLLLVTFCPFPATPVWCKDRHTDGTAPRAIKPRVAQRKVADDQALTERGWTRGGKHERFHRDAR
jgi:hypothetical protein